MNKKALFLAATLLTAGIPVHSMFRAFKKLENLSWKKKIGLAAGFGSFIGVPLNGVPNLISTCPEAKKTQVSMWGTGSIKMSPTDKEPKSISTFGLGGCTATGIYFKYGDGTQEAFIEHHPPTDHEQYKKLIVSKINSIKNNSNKNIEKITTIFVTPDEWEQDNKSKKWKLIPHERKPFLQQVTKKIKDTFNSNNAKVICEPYSGLMALDDHHLDFEIVLYPDPQKSYYQSKGDGHVTHLLNQENK